jgi:tetratricopeptide (TPR) repeat protein
MFRSLEHLAVFAVLLSSLLSPTPTWAQTAKPAASVGVSPTVSPDKAIALAEEGHCKDAIPALKRAMNGQAPEDTKKEAGVVGLRCSLREHDRDAAMDFIRLLNKQFPKDPDVLYILVHSYSDLSTQTALELGRTAPLSIPAHKLNAEALEMQGKWDEAIHEYEGMIAKEPNMPGLHFLLGRSLLSKPNPDPKDLERAKLEFQKEIEIDPKNAGAHYVVGELASKGEKWDEAIAQFSAAAKLDPNFAEAYLGWGFALVTVKRYQEAIEPLRIAERLTPGNPSIHYSLATALIRTGQKEEAEKEFAIHRELTTSPTPPAADQNPQPQPQ